MSTGIVGGIIGPVADVAPGVSATRAQDTGQGYDFAIGGLLFNVASDDQNPYQRATAQFKKDQIDITPTPGDQSLTGYWTRGQFSFHNGAGVEYYEVEGATSIYTLRSDTVIERFKDAVGVNPFTPGKAVLYPAWKAATPDAYTALTRVLPEGNNIVTLASGKVTYGPAGVAGTVYAPAGDNVVAMTTGVGDIFAALGTGKSIVRIDTTTTPATVTTIYTHSQTIADLFYAKDRIFMLDSTNTWYQLAPHPSGTLPLAVPASNRLFTTAGATQWCVTDSPGPVLLANGNRIFSVTTDTSGAMGTLTGPIQVADLPTTETIRGLTYMIGHLVISTDHGVRVADLSDAGTVTYGPLLFSFSSAPQNTGIGRLGSCAYVAGDHSVYVIDLSQQVGQTLSALEFSYTEAPNPFGAQTNYGLTALGDQLVAWADNTLLIQDSKLASGWLQTGYHRYATLEPKQFRSVKVRVAGDGGTVVVSRVMSDGSTVSLYTLDVSQTTGEVITLGLSQPEEMIGLRFDMAPSTADPTKGPTLLGYQLYALPAPLRQRMIEVPLLCFDVESRQPARRTGHRGAAWERLSALEEMERSGATFFFQDFRTGEAGECFIEAVEFKGMTPPTAASSGFGGLLSLTIRKL